MRITTATIRWYRPSVVRSLCGVSAALLLASCAAAPPRTAANGRVWDPKLGVWSSPRVVADGDVVPRGGGSYLTGRSYVIGGRTYVPNANPAGYTATGTASWYGDAFHGRRTANGEVFDKGSISAAHPTLPLPSYVRVTNLRNGRSMVVRVNDRGPYHGGRVMDVSQRVADALAFRGEGTARVRIDYVGRAPLQGSDDSRLLASLRTDGSPAQLDGQSVAPPVMAADGASTVPASTPDTAASPDPAPPPPSAVAVSGESESPSLHPRGRAVPLPPARPFTLGSLTPAQPRPDLLAALVASRPHLLGYAARDATLTVASDTPFRAIAPQGTLPLDAGPGPAQ